MYLHWTHVTPQVHGIHPPKALSYFSLALKKGIEKLWKASWFWKRRKKKRKKPKEEGREKAFQVTPKVFKKEREDYDPRQSLPALVFKPQNDNWKRVEGFFEDLLIYETSSSRKK